MNVIDYIKKHENDSFDSFHFSEVDSLIFSLIPYVNLEGVVAPFKGKKILLKEAAKLIDDKPKALFLGNAYKMFELMGKTKRYGDVLLYNYMNVVNKEMQFGAITCLLNNGTKYIAFAGTDTSIIGWEEDFKMAYLYPGASQKYAQVYINKAVKLIDRKVLVGGHSKGGNLAVSASMGAKGYIRRKISDIYCNDGPGFLKEQVNSLAYKRIEHKIHLYVPEQSIIGMLLYHQEEYTVVKARGFSILQHDAFNWQNDGDNFIQSKQNRRSKNLEIRLTKKIEELSISERVNLVNNIFLVFKNNNIIDTKEIKIKKLLSLIKSFKNLDKETKNQLLEFLIILFIG